MDLQPLFFRLTLNTTMFLLFGQMQNDAAASGDAKFAEAFNLAQDYLARRGRLGDLYWLIGGQKFRDACRTVHQFVDSIVDKALQASNAAAGGSHIKSNYVFVDALIQETKDPVVLRSQLLNILLAGRDTTACCLSWAL